MDTTTLLIIIIIVLLVGGGGWYGRASTIEPDVGLPRAVDKQFQLRPRSHRLPRRSQPGPLLAVVIVTQSTAPARGAIEMSSASIRSTRFSMPTGPFDACVEAVWQRARHDVVRRATRQFFR
jgi:hypothetical protein